MKPIIFLSPTVTINGTDVTTYCTKATVQLAFNTIDVSPMWAPQSENAQGSGSATITVDVFQDDQAVIDALIWPLVLAGTPVPVTIKRSSAAVSATNPAYSMVGLISDYTPMDANPGSTTTASLPFVCADPAGLTRATA